MIQAAKRIGTGLATTGLIVAGVGIGVAFGSLILGVSRNLSIIGQLFSYAILGFALSEATGLFALMLAFLLTKYKRVTRDKIKRLPFYCFWLISSRPFSTLPPIFKLYIKQTLFILTCFILLLYLFLVSIYLIWAIICIFGQIYITPIHGDNWIIPDLISYLTDNKLIKYLYLHKIEIFIYYILYFLISTFYRFCFNKILTYKHIIKFLPVKFAYRLTIKIKLKDIFLYFFSIKFIKFVILCWCLITIPIAVKIYLTGSTFDQTLSIIHLTLFALYISISMNIISCFLNKQKFWSTDNLFSIIILFLVIFCTKYTLNLIIFIPLFMGDLNIANIVNKPVIKNLNNLPKLLDKLPVINILKLSKILDINSFINRKFYLNKSRYLFLNNNQNLDLNKNGLLNKSKGLGNKIPTINYSNLILSNRLLKGNLGIIDTIKSRETVHYFKIINEGSNLRIEKRSYFICPSTSEQFYFLNGVKVISWPPKSKYGFDIYDSLKDEIRNNAFTTKQKNSIKPFYSHNDISKNHKVLINGDNGICSWPKSKSLLGPYYSFKSEKINNIFITKQKNTMNYISIYIYDIIKNHKVLINGDNDIEKSVNNNVNDNNKLTCNIIKQVNTNPSLDTNELNKNNNNLNYSELTDKHPSLWTASDSEHFRSLPDIIRRCITNIIIDTHLKADCKNLTVNMMTFDNQNQNTGAGQDQDMMNLDNENQNTGAGEQYEDMLIDDEQQEQQEQEQEENTIDLTEDIEYDVNTHEDFEINVLNNDLKLANSVVLESFLSLDNSVVESESLQELKTEYNSFFYNEEENHNEQTDLQNLQDICKYLESEIKAKNNINKINKEKDTQPALKEKTNKDPIWKSKFGFKSLEEYYQERDRVANVLKDEYKNKNPDVELSKETLHQVATSKMLKERNPNEYHKLRNSVELRFKRIRDRFAKQITSPNINKRQFQDFIPLAQEGPVQVGTSGIVNWQKLSRRSYIKEMIYTDPRNQFDTGYVKWINGGSNQPLAFNIAALLDRVKYQGQSTFTILMFNGPQRKFMVDFIKDPNNNLEISKSLLRENPQGGNILSSIYITNVLINTLRLLP